MKTTMSRMKRETDKKPRVKQPDIMSSLFDEVVNPYIVKRPEEDTPCDPWEEEDYWCDDVDDED